MHEESSNFYFISNERVMLCNEALSGMAVLATLINLVQLGSLIIWRLFHSNYPGRTDKEW